MPIFVRSFKTCEVSIFIIFLNLILFCLQRSEVKFQVSLVAQKKTRTKRARLRWVYFISCCLHCEVAEIGTSHCDIIG